jgi:hypothetical protein
LYIYCCGIERITAWDDMDDGGALMTNAVAPGPLTISRFFYAFLWGLWGVEVEFYQHVSGTSEPMSAV